VDQPGPCDLTFDLLQHLRVDLVEHPSPVVTDTLLQIRGESFIPETSCVVPRVSLVGSVGSFGTAEATLDVVVLTANELEATIPQGAISTLGGPGLFSGVLRVSFLGIQGGGSQADLPISMELAEALTPVISGVEQTDAYLNDLVTVVGAGFIGGNEGTTEIVLSGFFFPDDGEDFEVLDVRVPATMVTTRDRSRVTFPWSPRIGGVRPGTFWGDLTPQNTTARGGTTVAGPTFEVQILQHDTVLFGITPDVVSLGEIATISGRGFIGSPADARDDREGTTSFRLQGVFYPCSDVPIRCSDTPQPVDTEVIGEWASGTEVDYSVTVSNRGGVLHAVDFSAPRGRFEGSVTPVLTFGADQLEGIAVESTTLTLGPIRQICWVRFLPGFSESLDLFGLGAVENVIKERILARMQEIYWPPGRRENHINVEFRADEPDDFTTGGYAILDIGGPDPNNLGLFGYDNTPGKDVGNLRLWDHVGGENALGALDGYGYGGVFIESMLYWSEHPPSGERPQGAPPAVRVFDDIFDPVRDQEVVAGEYPNGAASSRIAQIEAAISFLSNMVADTSAHEFGHSLGLAQPFVPNEAYHNAIPQTGCLMDTGAERPLEERARLNGNEGARFCQENLWYLLDILPLE
jgi:hypothetical protein